MTTDRDHELGAELRALPTPEHDPAFWTDLEDRMAGELPMQSADIRSIRRFRPRGMWLLTAAAVVAVTVAAVAVIDGGAGTKVEVGPPATTPDGEPWTRLSESPLSGRQDPATAWTSTRLVVWGGADGEGRPLDDGALYDPVGERWEAMAPAPTGPLAEPVAVWTGTRVLVWGSRQAEGGEARSVGALYDPATDSWAAISPPPLVSVGQSVVWTGEALLVWGGSVGESPVADGAVYRAGTDSWSPMSRAPLQARFDHTAVWTGDGMLVWGGAAGEESPSRADFADGAAYDVATDAWTMLPAAPVAARSLHLAVWTGTSMVVWGGAGSSSGLLTDGAVYDAAARSWTTVPPSPLTRRARPSAVVAGGSVLIWGGESETGASADGAAFEVLTQAWRPLPAGPLSPRSRHGAVWTGSAMLVWGGVDRAEVRSDGAALRPPANAPVPGVPPTDPPAEAPTTAPVVAPPLATAACADIGFGEQTDDVAFDVVAVGLPCSQAEAFVRGIGGPLGPLNGLARVDQDGFVCVRTSQGDDGLPTSTYECTSGARRITFGRL